jgi:PDZ domain-containing protein
VVVQLIAGGFAIIVIGARAYYVIAPGSAPLLTESSLCRTSGSGAVLVLPNGRACARIFVPSDRIHRINGSIYMVSALVGPASPLQYALSKLGLLHLYDEGAQLVPAKAILGTTPPGQLSCQAAQQMMGATSSSALVALRHLGYQITENNLGAQLYQIAPGSPASAAGLHCNDVVVAVDDQPIRTSTDLVNAVRASGPGETMRFTVERIGSDGKVQTETLAARLGGPSESAGPARGHEGYLGVVSVTRTIYRFPFDVNIEVGAIGGPSAGLAFTLAILDTLSNGDLTGGHAVAATGTIELDGTIGDVGGVAQKAVAVRRAGAQVFFVPSDQSKDAQSEAASMRIYPVKNLQQALNDLQALGGHIPPSSGQTGAP